MVMPPKFTMEPSLGFSLKIFSGWSAPGISDGAAKYESAVGVDSSPVSVVAENVVEVLGVEVKTAV